MRARITQVLNLLHLAPKVLDAIASMADPMPFRVISEHLLRRLLKLG